VKENANVLLQEDTPMMMMASIAVDFVSKVDDDDVDVDGGPRLLFVMVIFL